MRVLLETINFAKKLSRGTIMELPLGWHFDKHDRYTCMCRNFRSYEPDEVQAHIQEDGYCLYGLKCIGESHYECICKKQFAGPRASHAAWNHVEDQLENKIDKCRRKHYSFCCKCNLQLKSVAAYKIHCTTRKHLNPREDGCEHCGTTYQGKKQKEKHLESVKHKQRVEEGTLPLRCDVCQISCDSQKKMKAHLETNKHKNQVVL